MNNDINIPGGKTIWVDGERLLAIGSCDLYQKDVDAIANFPDIKGVLFYSPRFNGVDLSALGTTEIYKLSFLNGNLDDQNLEQLERVLSLKSLKLLDTKVSKVALNEFQRRRPDVVIK